MSKLLILDGTGILYHSYYAIKSRIGHIERSKAALVDEVSTSDETAELLSIDSDLAAVREMDGRNDDFPIDSLMGMANRIIKLVLEQQPQYLCVAFDSLGMTHRREIFPDYKANRTKVFFSLLCVVFQSFTDLLR